MFKFLYYGQKFEDRHIYANYFLRVRGGTFLELGAHNGVLFSNTKFFEDALGWSGVLIEANPNAFSQLVKSRARSKCFNCAVSTRDGELDFVLNDIAPVSSVKDFTTEKHAKGWHETNNTQIIRVPSRTLGSILHEAGIRRIDFWSLDVEGGELEVLRSMDWSIPVYLICIETQEPDRKKLCDEILTSNGFQFSETYYHNEIWVNVTNRPHV